MLEPAAGDPFTLVEGEAARQLAEIGGLLTRWRQLSSSDTAQADKMRKLILKNLSEVGVDLQDMSATVDIATRDPTKFGLDTRELNRRSVFVLSSQRQVEEIRAEISESDGMNTPTKQRERRGLLSADSPGVPKRGSGGSRGQQEMQASNDHVVELEHMKQQQEVQQQDQQLRGLSGVMDRLGEMGRQINTELKAQGTALDELNADVDDTQTRMHTAMGVMKKMLKQKDRGKFCCILVLSVVLFVLVFLVLN